MLLSIFISNIWLCLFGSSLAGIGNVIGLLTIIGFSKGFDPTVVGGISSGTGGAGLAAAIYVLFLSWLNLPPSIGLIGILFTFIPYFFAFVEIIKEMSHQN